MHPIRMHNTNNQGLANAYLKKRERRVRKGRGTADKRRDSYDNAEVHVLLILVLHSTNEGRPEHRVELL